MKMNAMEMIIWILLFVGGINWGLVGFFKYDLVANILGGGDMTATLPRIIYALVGLAALWSLISMFAKGSNSSGGSSSMGSGM